MLCPQCGKEIPDESRFCFQCGRSLEAVVGLSKGSTEAQPAGQSQVPASGKLAPPSHTRYCNSCGSAVPDPSKFCNECGAQLVTLKRVDASGGPESRLAAHSRPVPNDPTVTPIRTADNRDLNHADIGRRLRQRRYSSLSNSELAALRSSNLTGVERECIDQEMNRRKTGKSLESSEKSPPTGHADTAKKSGCASDVGSILIVMGLLVGLISYNEDPKGAVGAMTLLIILGIGFIRGWSGTRIVLTLVCLCVAPLFVIIALPKYQKAQMFGRELGAIKAIQTIHQAEVQYQSKFGRYATSLEELSPPTNGPATPSASGLIGNDLSVGEKGQYKFTLTANAGGYVITAVPANPSFVSRNFYSDQSMAIHQSFGAEVATASSPEMK